MCLNKIQNKSINQIGLSLMDLFFIVVSLIVLSVCCLCYFGWKSTVSSVNVAEMIYFDVVKASVMRMVIVMPSQQRLHLYSLDDWMLAEWS